MPVTRLIRRVRFSAAHRYYRPEWSEARNRAVFGACANAHGHGHTYALEVTVEGPVDPETGFSVDLGWLDGLLRSEVMDALDHQHLNHAVPQFAEGQAIPTTENLAAWIWNRLEPHFQGKMRLVALRLQENEDLAVDYTAD
jgi:6-pyruvoyltetrahydropterin/6-carboxytetrahydropterin synthase